MNKKQQAVGGIQWGRMLKKLNPYTIQKGFRYLKHYGPKEFWIRLHERLNRKKFRMVHGMRLISRMRQNLRSRRNTSLAIRRRSVSQYRHFVHRRFFCVR